jgi:hypothetical protein
MNHVYINDFDHPTQILLKTKKRQKNKQIRRYSTQTITSDLKKKETSKLKLAMMAKSDKKRLTVKNSVLIRQDCF